MSSFFPFLFRFLKPGSDRSLEVTRKAQEPRMPLRPAFAVHPFVERIEKGNGSENHSRSEDSR